MTQEDKKHQDKPKPQPKTQAKPPAKPAEKSPPKTQLLHEELMQGLPSRVQRALSVPATAPPAALEPEESEYQRLLAHLPKRLRQKLDRPAKPKKVKARPSQKSVWCLCEQRDGDFPKVRAFDTPQKLARYLAGLDGQEISVWPLYGVPLRFTKPDASGQRFLFLPGEKKAVLIASRGPSDTIDADLLGESPDFQLDGWLGPPGLAEEAVTEFYHGDMEAREAKSRSRPKGKKPPKDDGDEEDDIGDPVED